MNGQQKKRVGPLDTVGRVASELGRTYRAMVKQEIDNETGRARAAVLSALRQALEVGEVERRLMELEAKGK